MKKVASLRYGVIFKKAFAVPEIFTGFVRDMLGIEIEIDKVETEKTLDPPIGRVASRFDLFAEDKKNRIIVDIQHERHADHYDRFLYYHSSALLEQAVHSRNYRQRMKVFTIVVLTSGNRHGKDIAFIDFDPRDSEGHPLGEIPHRILYICPKYAGDHTPEALREWMLAINDSLDEEVEESDYANPLVRKVFEHIEKDRISPHERAELFEEYNRQNLISEAKEEGIKEGKEKGIKEGMLEVACNMLKTGEFTHEQIARITGLSLERIGALSDSE